MERMREDQLKREDTQLMPIRGTRHPATLNTPTPGVYIQLFSITIPLCHGNYSHRLRDDPTVYFYPLIFIVIKHIKRKLNQLLILNEP